MGSGSSIPQSLINAELSKPLDASDVSSFEAAQAEVLRLRGLLKEYDRVPELIIAVDGSEISDACLAAGLRLRPAKTKVVVVTVVDPSKTDLPPEYNPKTIVDKFETTLVSQLPTAKYAVVQQQKNGRPTMKAICDYANDHETRRVQLLVLGMHGRKARGHKQDIMGQTSDYSLREAFCPVCIVKSSKLPKVDEKATFLVALDGSPRSFAAHELAVSLKKKNDKLISIFVNTDDKVADKVKAKITDAVEIEKRGGTTIAKHILQFMEEIEDNVTHLFIGADGMSSFKKGKRVFGSVSDKLVKDAKCSAVIVQSMRT